MDKDISHLDFPAGAGIGAAAIRAWRKPIEPHLAILKATSGKPLAELTMPELLTWGLVFSYAFATGMVIGQLAGNVLALALRGPPRLPR